MLRSSHWQQFNCLHICPFTLSPPFFFPSQLNFLPPPSKWYNHHTNNANWSNNSWLYHSPVRRPWIRQLQHSSGCSSPHCHFERWSPLQLPVAPSLMYQYANHQMLSVTKDKNQRKKVRSDLLVTKFAITLHFAVCKEHRGICEKEIHFPTTSL